MNASKKGQVHGTIYQHFSPLMINRNLWIKNTQRRHFYNPNCVCMYVWMDGWMDVWMYGCMDVWMHACMHACMHVCVCMYIYTYNTYILQYIPVYKYKQKNISVRFLQYTCLQYIYVLHTRAVYIGAQINVYIYIYIIIYQDCSGSAKMLHSIHTFQLFPQREPWLTSQPQETKRISCKVVPRRWCLLALYSHEEYQL